MGYISPADHARLLALADVMGQRAGGLEVLSCPAIFTQPRPA
jgi:hypothetical protein